MITRTLFTLTLVLSTLAFADDEVEVPAGPFQMGCSTSDKQCERDEGRAGGVAVTVPAFFIDKYEVTVAKYRECVSAGKCVPPTSWFCNYVQGQHEDHPMNCVNWNDAVSFCKFKNRRLPTEPEWEKAARAGTTTPFPWGQTASCRNAIVNDGQTKGSSKESLDGCGEDNTFPVGSRPANGFGLYDMNGNVVEWVSNWYAPNAQAAYYSVGKLEGPAEGAKRVARGGSWDDKVGNLRNSFRDARIPTQRGGSLGFRCARNRGTDF